MYAIQAIEEHGIFKGGLLTIRRILKCNPFFSGGWDPVPPKKSHLNYLKGGENG
jgi:hypothetical protein